MGRRALVTGCNGFVGGYLCDALLADGAEVHGLDIQESPRDARIGYSRADMRDEAAVRAAVASAEPDEVYHLAAVANPRVARDEPAEAFRVSVLGALNLLESCRTACPGAGLLFVGSSEEYRKPSGGAVVFRETDELDAASVYGASKIAAEAIARAYHAQFGVRAFFTRSFNHSGPGQAPAYVLSDFARQCAEMALGRRERRLVTGDIGLERDFLDVRDVVAAYMSIVARGRPGATYNVASGASVSLRALINEMLDEAGIDDATFVVDAARIRPGEPASVAGDIGSIEADTGWAPARDIRETVREMVRDWTERSRDGAGRSDRGRE